MMTTLSLRLQEPVLKSLEKIARLEKQSKSELIRKMIEEFIQKRSATLTPWELGKHVFGQEGSPSGNLAVNRKRLLKEKLCAKQKRRH